MKLLLIFILTPCVMLYPQIPCEAKTPDSEKGLTEQRELKSAHNERVREFEKFEAESVLERELTKKRTAQWKQEQTKLTQEMHKRRADRLSQIEIEKEKEMAARMRQKEIHAQLKLEESEYKAKLVKRKLEIFYGKEGSVDESTDKYLAEGDQAQKKPFWEKWLEPKE